MVALAYSVAFEGIEARTVEVQCAVTPGIPGFTIVGLPDKSVTEARERLRAALTAMSIALPSRRITVNLSPADLPKEGSHFDLPIALALLAALDIVPRDAVAGVVAMGELSLDGTLIAVMGALPAAMAAAEDQRGFLCPKDCAAEAAWVGSVQVIGARTLGEVYQKHTTWLFFIFGLVDPGGWTLIEYPFTPVAADSKLRFTFQNKMMGRRPIYIDEVLVRATAAHTYRLNDKGLWYNNRWFPKGE